ncbi:hypothetical protein [Rhodococcoides kyotonense]|uniref:hypothetical protein n=1 Tax=Rhodococcoides kyotonense TaxID=398843 RepID=UPI001FEC7650|nr:hypothetical protein [Rhodococcus kyotonensis]
MGSRAPKIDIDQEELGAMGVLAESGMVPRLRLVTDENSAGRSESLSRRDQDTDQRAV